MTARALVLAVEWHLALARRRTLMLCVLAPLAVVLVIATGGLPEWALAAAYVALFVGFTALATAWTVARDVERGMVLRMVRGGVSPAGFLLQRAAAGASICLAQLLPAYVVGAVSLQATAGEALAGLGALAIGFWTASLLGVTAGALGRSQADAVVVAGVAVLLLLHMSGVFETPAEGGLGAALERLSPFRMAHEALATMLEGGGMGTPGAIVWAVALPTVIVLLAPRLVRPPQRGRR